MAYTKRIAPKYTDEQINIAIELASKGEPLRRIIDAICTTEFDMWVYKQQHLDFAHTFEEARQEGLEHIADGLITIADEYTDVQRGRLKSDNAKWLLSKRKPAIYGDKVDIHVSQTLDIGIALAEARARALIAPSVDKARDVTPIDDSLDISGGRDAGKITPR
jgi:hypothetical protein